MRTKRSRKLWTALLTTSLAACVLTGGLLLAPHGGEVFAAEPDAALLDGVEWRTVFTDDFNSGKLSNVWNSYYNTSSKQLLLKEGSVPTGSDAQAFREHSEEEAGNKFESAGDKYLFLNKNYAGAFHIQSGVLRERDYAVEVDFCLFPKDPLSAATSPWSRFYLRAGTSSSSSSDISYQKHNITIELQTSTIQVMYFGDALLEQHTIDNVTPTEWHHYRFEAVGQTIKIYLDQNEIYSYDYASGGSPAGEHVTVKSGAGKAQENKDNFDHGIFGYRTNSSTAGGKAASGLDNLTYLRPVDKYTTEDFHLTSADFVADNGTGMMGEGEGTHVHFSTEKGTIASAADNAITINGGMVALSDKATSDLEMTLSFADFNGTAYNIGAILRGYYLGHTGKGTPACDFHGYMLRYATATKLELVYRNGWPSSGSSQGAGSLVGGTGLLTSWTSRIGDIKDLTFKITLKENILTVYNNADQAQLFGYDLKSADKNGYFVDRDYLSAGCVGFADWTSAVSATLKFDIAAKASAEAVAVDCGLMRVQTDEHDTMFKINGKDIGANANVYVPVLPFIGANTVEATSAEGYARTLTVGEKTVEGDGSGKYIFDYVANGTIVSANARKKYEVKFVDDGGAPYADGANDKTYEHGSELTAPEQPVKADDVANTYTFDGWYVWTGTDYGAKWKFSGEGTPDTVTDNLTLKAKFTAATRNYTIHWTVGEGGTLASGSAEETKAYNGEIVFPTVNAETGKKFTGWYKAEGGSEKIETKEALWGLATAEKAEITLYAHYEATKTAVTFALGEPAHGTLADKEETYTYGEDVTLPSPTPDAGYTFDGWYRDGGTQVKDGAWAIAEESLTLTAKWSAKTYTVKLEAGAHGAFDSEKTVEATYGEALTVTDVPTPAAGYVFTGWKHGDAEFASGTAWTFDEAAPVLTAQYRAKTFTLKFDYGADGTAPADAKAVTVTYGGTIPELPEPTVTNPASAFSGWFTEQTGGSQVKAGTAWTFKGEEEDGAEITLYARYGEKYTVTFDLQQGTGTFEPQYIGEGGSVNRPAETPEREGYDFAGWYKAADGDDKFDFEAPLTGTEKSITVYAHWTLKTYTVTFDPNYTGGTDETKTVNHGDTVTAPAPTRTGYTFGGWYREAACTAEFDFGTKITAETTLYAKWTANVYTVTYELDGGTNAEGAPETFTFGEGVGTLPAPTREGYTFDGWYDAATGGNKVTAIGADRAENVTLYARWTKNAEPPKPAKKGCGSTLGLGAFAIAGIAAAAVVLTKKKRK